MRFKKSLALAGTLVLALLISYFCSYNSATLLCGNETGIVTEYKQDADVKMDFYCNHLNGDYENLFQTAAGNAGLRFEFANVGTAGVCGLVYPEKDNIEAITVNGWPLPGMWHSLEAKIINDVLGLYIDDALVGIKSVDSKRVLFNDLASGTGFSRERNFSGEVKNFEVRLYKHQNVLGQLPLVIMIMLDLCVAYYVVKRTKITFM